jgi:hypothetical protein
VILLVAGFDAISFGFYVALNALTPVWLQKPVKAGGYGFSITDNATCKAPIATFLTLNEQLTDSLFSHSCALDRCCGRSSVRTVFQRQNPALARIPQ